MNTFTRHYISQKFGRAKGVVETDSETNGFVSLTFSDPKVEQRRFHFLLEDFRALGINESELHESILRTAISVSHRQPGGAGDAVHKAFTLKPQCSPWIGDFSEDACMGTTVAFRRRDGSLEERKATNEAMALSVERALALRRSEGKYAARAFLSRAGLQPSVIRRVLSNTNARRTFRPQSAPAGAE